jgi:hypothetical protein
MTNDDTYEMCSQDVLLAELGSIVSACRIKHDNLDVLAVIDKINLYARLSRTQMSVVISPNQVDLPDDDQSPVIYGRELAEIKQMINKLREDHVN